MPSVVLQPLARGAARMRQRAAVASWVISSWAAPWRLFAGLSSIRVKMPRGWAGWLWRVASLIWRWPCVRTWRGIMGARQKAWARAARAGLILALGGKCRACGAAEALQFDCLTATGGAHHAMEASARMCYYRKQARQGNVGLLCGYCNAMKSGLTRSEWGTALHFIADSETILLLTGTPGQGSGLTAPQRRELLREAVSRVYAKRRADAEIFHGAK